MQGCFGFTLAVEIDSQMRHVDRYITVLFAVVVPAFLIMPWISIVEDWPFALSGMALAFEKYNIQPTEYYALAAVVIAGTGAIGPHFLPRRKTLTRVGLAFAGMGLTLLMHIHPPEGYPNVQWRMGYWVSLVAFTAAAFVSVYTLGQQQGRRRRRR